MKRQKLSRRPTTRWDELMTAGLRHLAFATDDIDSAASELDRAGIAHEPLRVDEFTGKRFFFLRDPDDLPVEIYEA
jgi:glyoxylase I family protein